MTRHARVTTLAERFYAGYIPEPNTGCWLWIKACTPLGDVLDEAKVEIIRVRIAAGVTNLDIAREFGVGKHLISAIKIGRTWSHVK